MIVIKRLFIIACLLGLLNGCAYFHLPSHTNKPSLSLVDIKLKKANLFKQTFLAEISIDNPNDFDLPIDEITINVELEDHSLGEGIASQNFVVPANGQAVFKMRINTNLFGNLGTLKKIVDTKADAIHYRLTGNIDVGLPLFMHDIDFDKVDSIPTPNLHL